MFAATLHKYDIKQFFLLLEHDMPISWTEWAPEKTFTHIAFHRLPNSTSLATYRYELHYWFLVCIDVLK